MSDDIDENATLHTDLPGGRAAKSLKVRSPSVDQMKKYREALEFYADEKTWKASNIFMCGHSAGARIETDRGDKARLALKEPT